MDRLHPLMCPTPFPVRMNNPMGYVPHPLCIAAAEEVMRCIGENPEWREDADRGKMFGVLVVEDEEGRPAFLAAFSGLLANRNDWEYFVPPVFDFQQPDGYFKREEAEITQINRQVTFLEQSREREELLRGLQEMKAAKEADLAQWKAQMETAKRRRDAMRGGGLPATMTTEQMLRESQWMKAEMRRKRQRHDEGIARQTEALKALDDDVARLRAARKERSEALQQWLFDHFRMLNARGEERTLTDIFAQTAAKVPPAGAGECCAPKLLQHAYKHHLTPRCMAEFWWGKSPTGEVRRHGAFYPACRGKCLPILQHMLQGLDMEENQMGEPVEAEPDILFEDPWLMVLCKPSGMLAVPGKGGARSVYDFARDHCPEADGPLIVHRLDMDTSGLMVVAKTKWVHQRLQAQFNNRTVEKTYVAVLERPLPKDKPRTGTIDLPLRPDPLDRPRQVVDHVHGKRAVTQYEMLDEQTVLLHPHTGRTHQLRVHCAHQEGLDVPIKGDPLYGTPGERLFLHAAKISFTHPASGERLTFQQIHP